MFKNFKQSFDDQLTFAYFTALIEKNFTFLSFIYQINSKKPPNSVQTLRLPLEKATDLLPKPENIKPFFTKTLQNHFL